MKELHALALEQPAEERVAFVRRAAADHAELESEVLALLAVDLEAAERRLRSPLAETQDSATLRGRTLGGYRLLEKIGGGGMGLVYLAESPAGRIVALKMLTRVASADARAVERFVREIRALEKLQHPGIVRILGSGEEQGQLFYVMEYVSGQSLGTVLARAREGVFGEPLDLRDHAACVEMIARMLEGLQHAHEREVLHRDIKPENVMLDESGAPKLVDFGIARLLSEEPLTLTGELSGTPYYMSPEQAAAARQQIDQRSDLFSVSVVLYELLTLRRPFDGSDPNEVLSRILHHDPPPITTLSPRVSRPLAMACHHALAKDPRYRFDSALEFADALRRAARGETLFLRGEAWHRKLARRAARRPLVLLAAALAAAVLALGAILFLSLRSQSERERLPPAEAPLGSEERRSAKLELKLAPELGECRVESWFEPADPTLPLQRNAELRVPAGGGTIALEPGPQHVRVHHANDVVERELDLDPRTPNQLVIQVPTVEPSVPRKRFSALDWPTYFPGAGVFTVRVESFEIDVRPVSVREFLEHLRAIDAQGYLAKGPWSTERDSAIRPEWHDLPATWVTASEARRYAARRGLRLPTSFEWEIACLDGDVRRAAELARRMEESSRSESVPPTETSNDYGAFLRSAPVLRSDAPLAENFGRIVELSSTRLRLRASDGPWRFAPGMFVTRGSSWAKPPLADPELRPLMQSAMPEIMAAPDVGFRCARSVDR
ncbi:MAG: protein kinase [Planctomycetes bacterium]|nr:protein kinase [Planctomycetota bacterium]